MTKIRCQICGGERLHTEGSLYVVCDDCNNRSIVIPESAIINIDNLVDNNIVTLKFDRRKTDFPRKTFCLNDRMDTCDEPCKVCKVVNKRYNVLTNQVVNAYDKREQYIKDHPEIKEMIKDVEHSDKPIETWK